jgi:chromosome segregation ATPase
LQRRAAAGEARGEALALHALDATVPLMRQIEALQKAAIERAQTWDSLEHGLRSQLREADARQREALEAQSATVSQVQEVARRLRSAEAEIARMREEAAAAAETGAQREAKWQGEVKALNAELGKTKEELAQRTQQVLSMSSRRSTGPTSPPLSPAPAATAPIATTVTSPSPPPLLSSSSRSLRDLGSSQRGGSAMPLEKLASMLSQREGELAAVQSQLAALNAVKAELEEEVARLTGRTSDMQAQIDQLSKAVANAASIERRHDAALILLGEQQQRVEELLLDIEDMKATYRAQLAQLAAEKESLIPPLPPKK